MKAYERLETFINGHEKTLRMKKITIVSNLSEFKKFVDEHWSSNYEIAQSFGVTYDENIVIFHGIHVMCKYSTIQEFIIDMNKFYGILIKDMKMMIEEEEICECM